MIANKHIAKFINTLDALDLKGVKVPGLILSHAGFGKTSTIKLYCDYKGYNLVTLIPSMFSSDDILGIQSVNNGRLVRLTPSWFNKMKETLKNGKRTVLFIDEITTCDPYIQGPLLDLIFNGNLGEEHLPENIFIVAAGNYSADLNSVFKMSAPLVNRFMLLNLRNEDFDMRELVDGTFEQLKSKPEIRDFLDLGKSGGRYSFEKFKAWMAVGDEIEFGDTNYTEDEEYGLLGFTSIRSVSYALKFAEAYMGLYNDDLWIRAVGDTLGTSKKREGKPLQIVIRAHASTFKNSSTKASSSKPDIAKMRARWSNNYNSLGITKLPEEDLEELEQYVAQCNIAEMTAAECTSITNLISQFIKFDSANNMRLTAIGTTLNRKMDAIYG